jgi:hypothetical protein
MSFKDTISLSVVALIAAVSIFAQSPSANSATLGRMYAAKPWTDGASKDAMAASKAGATIPMSSYSIVAKDGKTYKGTIAGTNPWATTLSSSTIPAVIVPVVVTINSNVFDPTAPNNCGAEGGQSAMSRLLTSPLAQPVSNLTFDGTYVGNLQYVDGSMRAQFWNTIVAKGDSSGAPLYTNPIVYANASPVSMVVTGSNGITAGSGCTLLGVVNQSTFSNWLATEMRTLTSNGVISPVKVALFLLNNVTLSAGSPPAPPDAAGCCVWGYHSATGRTPQIYSVITYTTTGCSGCPPSTAVAAHEIAELMNDPLGSNPTPAWGAVGDVSGCQSNLEVADPLVGSGFDFTFNGYVYHLPQYAFFSWFFNSPTTPSLGTGGLFASNGAFTGPAKACPPGGTY